MEEEAIKRLASNLTVLQGYIREANFKLLALERVIQDLGGPHYERYRRLVLEYENDPRTFYPLEDLAGLQEALRKGRG